MRKRGLLKYVALFVIIMALYIAFRAAGFQENHNLIQGIMTVLLLEDVAFIVYKKCKGQLDTEDVVKAVLYAGLVMRIGYMLYNGFTVRSHDLGEISLDGYGHAAYVLKLMKTGHLPETSLGQFYQQPLFYFLGSTISWLVNSLLKCNEIYYLVDASKLVSCFASCGTLLAAHKIFEVTGLKDKGHVIALSLVAFMPDFYLLSSRVNCDALAGFFMTLAMLYTFYWYKEHSWKNTLCLAFIYGFAMMTKISCGVMALFTAGVFVKALYDEIKVKKTAFLAVKYLAFGCISFPLGLWYSLRNYRLFGQSLTYVPKVSEKLPIYIGNRSIVQRLFYIDIANLFKTPYADPWKDYSFPVYLVKSALFGEFKYTVPDWIPVILLSTAVILGCLLIGTVIWQLGKNRKSLFVSFSAAIVLIIYISTLFFCQRYPYGCSMDFRYIVFMVIPAGAVMAEYYSKALNKSWQKFVEVITIINAVFSCIMYIMVK